MHIPYPSDLVLNSFFRYRVDFCIITCYPFRPETRPTDCAFTASSRRNDRGGGSSGSTTEDFSKAPLSGCVPDPLVLHLDTTECRDRPPDSPQFFGLHSSVPSTSTPGGVYVCGNRLFCKFRIIDCLLLRKDEKII